MRGGENTDSCLLNFASPSGPLAATLFYFSFVSLLLKALKQTETRPVRSRAARLSTSPPESAAPAQLSDEVKASFEEYCEPILDEPEQDETQLDPAEFVFGETALIAPFEPIEATAGEFLAADALPDFEALEADSEALEVCEATQATEEETQVETQSGVATLVESDAPAEADSSADEVLPFALSRLEELQKLLSRERTEDAAPTIELVQPESFTAKPNPVENLPLREEFRELRDHLLTRFPLTKPSTLLIVDAGRVVGDASWLMPLATSIIQKLGAAPDRAPKVLIVEAAGPDCSVARGAALQCSGGLSDVLASTMSNSAAITTTECLQIYLLARGNQAVTGASRERLPKVWADLQEQFDLILIAAGPIQVSNPASRSFPLSAEHFLPLADGVILSVELSGTPQVVATQAISRLGAHRAKLIGSVVHGEAA